MHIYFSGIGGAGLAQLAHLALDYGFRVSGSDLVNNERIEELQKRGASIHLSQTGIEMELINRRFPIYWFVHTSAIKQDHPELVFAHENGMKISKRSGFVNFILRREKLDLIGIVGTHGKTTTTSMLVWLLKNLNIPVSYFVGFELSWARSSAFEEGSKFFVAELDEFDRNFLEYTPTASILTSIDYDHNDTYPTQEDYNQAFYEYLLKNKDVVIFQEDLKKIGLEVWHDKKTNKTNFIQLKRIFAQKVVNYDDFKLLGLHNRQNAVLVKSLLKKVILPQLDLADEITDKQIEAILSQYPGAKRRMEKLAENYYSDYAHHPTEIRATIQMALELGKKVVVIYQPHQNVRQHEIQKDYYDAFNSVEKVYWVPTFLSR